jgi:hypothetical protein
LITTELNTTYIDVSDICARGTIVEGGKLTCPQGGQLLAIAGPVFALPLSLMVTGPTRPLNGISKYERGLLAWVVNV